MLTSQYLSHWKSLMLEIRAESPSQDSLCAKPSIPAASDVKHFLSLWPWGRLEHALSRSAILQLHYSLTW